MILMEKEGREGQSVQNGRSVKAATVLFISSLLHH